MTGAFVPVVTNWRVKGGDRDAWDFTRRMLWTNGAIMVVVVAIGVFAAPWVVHLFTLKSPAGTDWSLAVLMTRITFPYALVITLAAIASAALNSVRVFGIPASASIFLNLALVGSGLTAWLLGASQPAVYLAFGFLLGGMLQFLIQLPSLVRRGMPLAPVVDFRHPGIREVWTLLIPSLAGIGVYQLNVMISTVFASESEGWIGSLFFANRLTGLVLGVIVVSVAIVSLPVMSQQAAEGRVDEMCRTLGFTLRTVGFIVIPAAAGLILLREPIVRVLFEHRAFDSAATKLTAWPLMFYALGLPAFAGLRLVVQGFYATKDMRTPVHGAIVAVAANLAFCFLLVGPMGQGGLALATTLATYLNVAILYWILRTRIGDVGEKRLLISTAKTVLASSVMAAACWWLMITPWVAAPHTFLALLGGTALVILAGVAVYFGMSWLLSSDEMGHFFRLISGRARALPAAAAGGVVPDDLESK